jgi:hypothetical protein
VLLPVTNMLMLWALKASRMPTMATILCGVIFKPTIPYYYSSTILGGKYIHYKIVNILIPKI